MSPHRRPAAALALALALAPACAGEAPAPPAALSPPALAPPAPALSPSAASRPAVSAALRPIVLAPDPSAAGPRALAAALGAPLQPWPGRWPPPQPDALWLLWWADAAPGAPLPLPEPGGPRPDLPLIVVPPGAADGQGWRPLAKVRVSVVDPLAALRAWDGPAAAASPAHLALAAAEAVGRHFDLPVQDVDPGGLPPGLAGALGRAADPAAPDPRLRRGVLLPADPDVAVRLAAAARAPDPALAADPEPLVRARAARRLDDDGALERLLADPSSVVRVVAAQRLVERAPASAAARAALRGLAAHPDAYLRWKAATGMAGDPSAVDLLVGMLRDPDIDVRREAAAALGWPPAEPAAAARALEGLLGAAADPNSFVRRRAGEALGAYRDPRAASALQQLAADPTSLVAGAAAAAGARAGLALPRVADYAPPARPADAAAAALALQTRDATVQKDLCKVIAGEPWAGPLLRGLLAAADSEVRKAAVEALGQGPGAVDALHDALADPDPDVRITALVGLAAQPLREVGPLLPLLDAPDAEERLRAAEALAAAARAGAVDPALEPALARLAGDPDERARAAAVGARPALLDPAEPSVLALRAAVAAGAAVASPQSLVEGARPCADPALAAWAAQVIQVEDDLLHVVFSWSTRASRPLSHWVLRPLPPRAYGQPNRG